MAEHLIHPIPPLYHENSRVLILGSFPSVKSREAAFFYGHPQNRFWPLLAALTQSPVPSPIEEKRALVLSHHLALWDTIASCEITGSSDSSIKNVVPNDLTPILEATQIRTIFCNGTTSWKLYQKYLYPQTGIPAHKLPSTSPANAAWTMPRLIDAWQEILPWILSEAE